MWGPAEEVWGRWRILPPPPPPTQGVHLRCKQTSSSLRFQLASTLGTPQAAGLLGGPADEDKEEEGQRPPLTYHVHLDEQDPQGEALPQALQPPVDVVRVEVVVAEAGGGEGEGGIGRSPSPRFPRDPGALLPSHRNAEGASNTRI